VFLIEGQNRATRAYMNKKEIAKIDCSKHKKKGKCKQQGCKATMKARQKCPKCGTQRYRAYCNRGKLNHDRKNKFNKIKTQ
jgi:hypothetical protein